jgi:hypothetical protein
VTKAGTALAVIVALLAQNAGASNFNDFIPGPKAMGMGNAFGAIADDPYAMFFNPAGTANTPYLQFGGSAGRALSPVGTMSWATLTYLRPFDPINTATVGTAYYAERQVNSGDKDEFLFHFSREVKVPQFFLSKPLKVGGNFKILNVEDGGGAGIGFGFDVGALARTNYGQSFSFAMKDLNSNVGMPRPVISLGTAYTMQRWLTFAADLRVRNNSTQFYPGIEASTLHGLLKIRAGRGFALDGVETVSFGLGLNFSPAIIDIGMSVPPGGINRTGGMYQAGLSWRFGAPSFTGAFVGQAAGQADQLRTQIQELSTRKKDLDAQTQTSNTHLEISEGEVKVLEQRVKELQEQYREMQKRRDEIEYDLRKTELERSGAPQAPRPVVRAPEPKPRVVWPRKHEVKAGETLRSLARQYYGDPNLWERIYDANKDKVNRGLPQEGATLVIPAPFER